MDNIDYKIVQLLASEKSMMKAAEKLFISQPAISYRMNQMEKEFGKQLFIRGNRGISFTDAGNKLLKYADKMIKYDEEIHEVLSLDDNNVSGQVRIGTFSSFLTQTMVMQLQSFCKDYPKVNIYLELFSTARIFKMLEGHELIMGIVRGNDFPSWRGESLVISRNPLLIIANEPISDEYLMTHPFISNENRIYNLPINSLIDDWAMNRFDHKFKVSQVRVSGNSSTRIGLVKGGFGWSIIPADRLNLSDGLYNQMLTDKNGKYYYINTQLLYYPEVYEFATYKFYLKHFMNYFGDNRL